jgi:hypothetical protein
MIAMPVGAVGEPLDQRGHRRDVADAEADAADDAVAEDDQPVLPGRDAERGDQEAEREADGRDEHRPARAVPLHQRSTEGGGQAQHDDAELEGEGALGAREVERVFESGLEDAPRVRLPDGEMYGKRGRGNQPPAPGGGRHGTGATQKPTRGGIFQRLTIFRHE